MADRSYRGEGGVVTPQRADLLGECHCLARAPWTHSYDDRRQAWTAHIACIWHWQRPGGRAGGHAGGHSSRCGSHDFCGAGWAPVRFGGHQGHGFRAAIPAIEMPGCGGDSPSLTNGDDMTAHHNFPAGPAPGRPSQVRVQGKPAQLSEWLLFRVFGGGGPPEGFAVVLPSLSAGQSHRAHSGAVKKFSAIATSTRARHA